MTIKLIRNGDEELKSKVDIPVASGVCGRLFASCFDARRHVVPLQCLVVPCVSVSSECSAVRIHP